MFGPSNITLMHIGVSYEVLKEEYLRDNDNDPLRALIQACGKGHMGALMALSPLVADINVKVDGEESKYLFLFVVYFVLFI